MKRYRSFFNRLLSLESWTVRLLPRVLNSDAAFELYQSI